MIRITVLSSILVMVVLLIRKCFYYHITRRLQYALWLSVPLYLILAPFLCIEIPVHGGQELYWIMESGNRRDLKKEQHVTGNKQKETTGTQVNKQEHNKVNNINIQNKITNIKTQASGKGNMVKYWIIKIFKIVYFIVSIGIIILILLKNSIFISKCYKERKYYKTDSGTGLKVYIWKGASTPFLLGKSVYINPVIIQDTQYLKYILLHEYCHWKHGDSLWVIVKYGIIALLWYNPLIWAASYYEECDCELACDEAVIKIAGQDKILQYGDALLYLALKKVNRNIIIQSMAGRSSNMLKERISYIILEKKNKRITILAVILIAVIVFAGLFVSFTDSPQAMQKASVLSGGNTKDNVKKADSIENKTEVMENNYYNCMKTDGTYIYYPLNNKLVRTCIKTGENKEIAEADRNSFFRLGDIAENYLYYTKVGSPSVIGRISLSSLSDEIIYREESGNSWGFGWPHIGNDGTVYCEEKIGTVQKCHMYKFNNGEGIWETCSNSLFMKKAEETEEKLNADLFSDYIQAVENNIMLFYNPSGIFIYNKDGKQLDKIEGTFFNIMLADKGVVYTDEAYNIYLYSYNEPYNSNIIFKPDSIRAYFNYAVYDQNGLYGIYKNKDNKYILARLSWNGGIKILHTFSSKEELKGLGVSAFGSGCAFLIDGKFEFIEF